MGEGPAKDDAIGLGDEAPATFGSSVRSMWAGTINVHVHVPNQASTEAQLGRALAQRV